jgi:hypothetical protein
MSVLVIINKYMLAKGNPIEITANVTTKIMLGKFI